MEKLKNMKWYYWVLILGILGGLYYYFMVMGRDAESLAKKCAELEVKNLSRPTTDIPGVASWYLNAANSTAAINPDNLITKPIKDMSSAERSKLYTALKKM